MFKQETVQIGVAPINWSNDDMRSLGGDITFEQCIDEIAQAGYAGCEVNHKFPTQAHILRPALDQRNLSLASAWFSTYFTKPGGFDETVFHFKAHMNLLKKKWGPLSSLYVNVTGPFIHKIFLSRTDLQI